jgi:CBS domain-containing protein
MKKRKRDDPLNETAQSAVEKSCYLKIDFKVSETASVLEAIQRMAGHHIGCLAVTEGSDPKAKVIGVISERDYLCKVALLGKTAKATKVSEIMTHGAANLIVVDEDEPIDECMKKMLARDIRHLLVRNAKGDIVSMLSIKDLVKVVVAKHQAVVQKLTDFALGKGAFYGAD